VFKRKAFFIGLFFTIAMLLSACGNDKADQKESGTKTADEVKTLAVSGDTVSEKAGCVLQSRFSAGDKIIFRMNAVDPNTNKQAKNAKLQVHLSTGEVLDMKLQRHPPTDKSAPQFWTAAYEVTKDTPTGILDYYVTATDGDKKGKYQPFKVQQSMLTIVSKDSGTAKKSTDSGKTSSHQTTQNLKITATNFKFSKEDYYVKAGQEVTLTLTSKEGVHGLMIDGLDVNIKAPGGTAKFTPKKAGDYQIHCNTYCGEGHGNMTATLHVE